MKWLWLTRQCGGEITVQGLQPYSLTLKGSSALIFMQQRTKGRTSNLPKGGSYT